MNCNTTHYRANSSSVPGDPTDSLRVELIQRICRLPADRLAKADVALRACEGSLVTGSAAQNPDYWPHAPLHRLSENGTYMVTTGTYQKAHIFRDEGRLTLLQDSLFALARQYQWQLEAWAIFSNHYHFVGHSLAAPPRLDAFLKHLHSDLARTVNELDGTEGRKVWHNFWEKQLTFERSYLARLNYAHQNAVKHRLVPVANQYRWCSAAWFERTARPAQVKTIYSLKTDRLQVADDFEPLVIV